MGMTKIVEKFDGENKIKYYCTNCEKLLGVVAQVFDNVAIPQFSTNCFICGEQLTRPIIVSEAIIDEVKFKNE